MKSLITWVGLVDFKGAGLKPRDQRDAADNIGGGPILNAVKTLRPNEVLLIHAYASEGERKQLEPFKSWLRKNSDCGNLHSAEVPLKDPTDHEAIYGHAKRSIDAYKAEKRKNGRPIPDLYFFLSPGTPGMHAVMLLLGKAVFNARLLKSRLNEPGRKEYEVVEVRFPIDLRAERTPEADSSGKSHLKRLMETAPGGPSGFADMPQESEMMREAVARARLAARWDWAPVLLLGEVGTGKANLAKAIQAASPRAGKPFIQLNCGAAPPEGIEPALFGKNGAIAQAEGGTLFLDEIDELPLSCQIRLLDEVIASRKPDGKNPKGMADVRVVAAAGLDLDKKVAERRFRQDLYYRLHFAAIRVPALREREGDIGILIQRVLGEINETFLKPQGKPPKSLSVRAETRLIHYRWPGNLRQLTSVINRLALLTPGESIDLDDVEPPVPT